MGTHNMKEDFKRCMAQYEACGGIVNQKFMTDAVLDGALALAKSNAMGNGRKVGNHAACSDMFDAEMIAAVKKVEGTLFLGSKDCCSSQRDCAYSSAPPLIVIVWIGVL